MYQYIDDRKVMNNSQGCQKKISSSSLRECSGYGLRVRVGQAVLRLYRYSRRRPGLKGKAASAHVQRLKQNQERKSPV